MGRLDDKVAIITGGGSGMGQTQAILFANEGAKIVVTGRTAKGLEETVGLIKEAGNEATHIQTDVSEAEHVQKLVQTAVNTYGKLNILVNGAAINWEEISTVECREEVFDKTMAINIKGVWLGMKYAIPAMIESGGGSIINIASLAADRGFPGMTAYSASKGAVVSMSRVAAVEYASKNIRVNCISPGPIATPLLLNQWGEDMLQLFRNLTPKAELGTPEEVGQVALFLASDESSHMTAQNLIVDGGMFADSHVER